MKSLRAKFTVLTVLAVMISSVSIGLISIYAIKQEADISSRQQMLLVCETRLRSLDSYFNSIEQSVETVSRFAEEDLVMAHTDVTRHLSMVGTIFHSIAGNTNGVLTYYYRMSPEFADRGFWYSLGDTGDFVPNQLTDVTAYDPDDVSHVGWFTIPQERGVPSWLEPYYNENLGVEMISYVAPIYYRDSFIGVIGMDVSYDTLVEQLEDVTLFQSGYAFLTNEAGEIVYHPTLESGASIYSVSDGFAAPSDGDAEPYVRYRFDGINKRAAWSTLSNGMRLYVTAPESEIKAGELRLIYTIIPAAFFILIFFVVLTALVTGHITEPLSRLTEAAKQVDAGNYDVELDYSGQDEVGILTGSFRQLTGHLKVYINDLNSRANRDALTSVRNKGAYDIFAQKLQERLDDGAEDAQEFALCMFDCNDLKAINDRYGHDKGDLYLKAACALICRVFQHSPVFRIGGDEFIIVLQNSDFTAREELLRRFDSEAAATRAALLSEWERVSVAKGVAVFDPALDHSVDDVFRRADAGMYQDKKQMKHDVPGAGRKENDA